MKKKFDGRAYLLGDNIGINQIIPAKYIYLNEPAELAQHILEGSKYKLSQPLEKGSIIVAGENFGCGPSCEQPAIAFKAASVACIIAASFGRTLYRTAINQGIPLIENAKAHASISEGEIITIDFENCEIICKKDILKFKVLSEVVVKILSSGGLIPSIKKSLEK